MDAVTVVGTAQASFGGLVGRLSVLALLTLGSGCVHQTPRARPIVGPDGTHVFHVSCGSDQGACFELAGRSCPSGYRMHPVFDERSNNFLVRCESSAHVTVAQATPSTVVIRSLSPSAGDPNATPWPPASRGWMEPDPWATAEPAPPESTIPLPGTARLPDGRIDIGY